LDFFPTNHFIENPGKEDEQATAANQTPFSSGKRKGREDRLITMEMGIHPK
jgi:hypothetical protein